MKIKFYPFLILLISTKFSLAQTVDYKANAENLRKTIWESPKNGFELKSIPANLKSESAVILSKSYETEATSKKKLKYMVITAGIANQINEITTYHERTILNDKSALEDYSTLSYQKKLDQTTNLGITKIYDEAVTYLGVKVVKPDGKEIIVDTSEEVLLKNSNSDQKGKLAIPDLQVGDIVDFYLCYVEKTEVQGKSFYDVNILNSDYYTLNYSFDYTYGENFIVNYTVANNCPDFIRKFDGEGNTTYHLEGKNIPKKQDNWWTSAYRTYPFFEMKPVLSTAKIKNLEKQTSNLSHALKVEKYANSYFNADKLQKEAYIVAAKYAYDNAKSSYKGGKEFKSADLDSVLSRMYDYWRFKYLYAIDKANSLKVSSDLSSTFAFSYVLEKNNIPHEIMVSSSRYWKKLEDCEDYNDLFYSIKIIKDEPTYIFFDNVYSVYNEIPSAVQGEKAYSIYQFTDTKNYVPKIIDTTIPVRNSKQNVLSENLEVSLILDQQKIKVKRLVTESGTMKLDDQESLLDKRIIYDDLNIFEKNNYDESYRKVSNYRRADTQAALDNSLQLKDNYFKELIDYQYGTPGEQITDNQILNSGLKSSNASLSFSSSFVLKDFLQKAGPNYLLSAGKLMGTVSAVKPDERNRIFDVYMPSARTLEYKISVLIPSGCNLKGIDNLNKTLMNECGSLTSKAALNGQNLIINITRVYNNNFEKASNWPKLVSLIDMSYDLSTQKVLLEKK